MTFDTCGLCGKEQERGDKKSQEISVQISTGCTAYLLDEITALAYICFRREAHFLIHDNYLVPITVKCFVGKMRTVRRSLFPQSSALGSGVLWEWANDEGGWTAYEIRTSILLEHSYQAGQATADLSPQGYNYIVDLTALEQVNKTSSFRRRVRRQGSMPYPLTSGSVIHSGPACTCHQCVSNSSTAGPMLSRSRHSFSAGQANRPSLQTQHGRLPGTSSSSAYSPYPRRPLSMGNLLWNAPWSTPTSVAHPTGPPQAFGHHANGLR